VSSVGQAGFSGTSNARNQLPGGGSADRPKPSPAAYAARPTRDRHPGLECRIPELVAKEVNNPDPNSMLHFAFAEVMQERAPMFVFS